MQLIKTLSVVGISALFVGLCACTKTTQKPDEYLIPKNYVGWAEVDYFVKEAPSLPETNEQRSIKIPDSGYLKTSSDRQGKEQIGKFYSYSGDSKAPLDQGAEAGMIWGFNSSSGDPNLRNRLPTAGSRTKSGNNVVMSDQFFVGTKQQFREATLAADELGNGPAFGGIDIFSKKLESDPQDWQAYEFRGNCQAAIGPSHYQLAIDDFSKEIDLAENFRKNQSQSNGGSHPGFIATRDTTYSLLHAYTKRAEVYTRLGEHQKAVDDCSKAITFIPEPAAIYYKRAQAYKAIGETQKAKEDLTKALSLDSTISKSTSQEDKHGGNDQQIISETSAKIFTFGQLDLPYRVRAQNYLALAKPRLAIDDLLTAIKFNSKNWQIYSLAGQAYDALSQRQNAVEDYNKALELIPKGRRYEMQRTDIESRKAGAIAQISGNRNSAQADSGKTTAPGLHK